MLVFNHDTGEFRAAKDIEQLRRIRKEWLGANVHGTVEHLHPETDAVLGADTYYSFAEMLAAMRPKKTVPEVGMRVQYVLYNRAGNKDYGYGTIDSFEGERVVLCSGKIILRCDIIGEWK